MVAETLCLSGSGHDASSLRRTVVFPTPEGPETTTNLPREDFAVVTQWTPHPLPPEPSLDVLDHLPEPLDRRLDLDHLPGDLHVVGLGADGVCLAGHFLG